MKNLKLFLAFLFIALFVFVFSCKEEEENDTETTTNNNQILKTVQDYTLASKLFSDSFSESDKAAKQADEEIDNNSGGQKSAYPIVTITPFDAVTWPKTITVDYGTDNFLCQDGRLRRGKLIIETTGFYRNENTVITINYDNYYQNNYKLEGTQTITNLGRDNNDHLHYSVEISNGLVISSENDSITFEENTVRTWLEGEETIADPCDDVYNITGSQNGTGTEGLYYTLNIIQPLNVLVCCKWIRGGVINFDIEGLETITINYGDNSCDQNATVTIFEVDYPIVMQ